MGPSFVLFAYLIVAAVGAAVWVVLFAIFLIGRRKRSRLMMWLGGVPLVAETVIVAVVGTFVTVAILRSMSPSWVFTHTFHEAPGPDVQELRSKFWWFADSGFVARRFKTSEDTFDRLRPRPLMIAPKQEFEEGIALLAEGLSAQWRLPEDPSALRSFRRSKGGGAQFASETECMTYDRATQTAIYLFEGID